MNDNDDDDEACAGIIENRGLEIAETIAQSDEMACHAAVGRS